MAGPPDSAAPELLPGGMSTVVRIGETVRRPAGPWTPAVHALLRHLRAAGFSEAPEPLGLDGDGREVLRYIPGQAFRASPGFSDARLCAFARLIRRYHEAARGFAAPPGAAWQFAGEGPLLCHNDLAPRNVVFEGDRPVGLLDWDLAAPGTAEEDLAHAAWESVPLRDDRQCEALGWRSPPDRCARLRLFLDAYGLPAPARRDFIALVLRRASATLARVELGARQEHPGLAALAAAGLPAEIRRELAWITAHRDALQAALR